MTAGQDLKKIRFEDRRWMKLAQNCVQWRAVVLAVLKPTASVTRDLVNQQVGF